MGLQAPKSKKGDHFFTQTSPQNAGIDDRRTQKLECNVEGHLWSMRLNSRFSVVLKTSISWGVAKCVHEIGRNQKIEPPHFRFKWCFLCSGGLNMMILDQIIQKKTKTTTKTTTKQPKTSTHCFWFLWTGQGTFLVQDFHRPNGAKILRFRNFPETVVQLKPMAGPKKLVLTAFLHDGDRRGWFPDPHRLCNWAFPVHEVFGVYL